MCRWSASGRCSTRVRPSRRLKMILRSLIVFAVTLLAVELRGADTPPVRVSSGPHLFIDEYLIASSHNLKRVVNQPVRDASLKNPIITGREDGCFQPYMTVLRDPTT